MRRRLTYASFSASLWILVGSLHGFAQDADVTPTLTALSTNMAAVQSVETRFVQEKKLAFLDHAVSLTGQLYMVKPNRFAWHVLSPVRYSLVMREGTVRQWDAEADSETHMSLEKNPALQVAIDQMRQWFSGDYLKLRSDYLITQTNTDPIELAFVPITGNAAANFIDRVEVRFTTAQRYIDRITIREKGGDQTTIRFLETKLNQPIPDAAWDVRFAPPGDRDRPRR